MKVITTAQMRAIDRACEDIGLPTSLLMENAGRAFAEETVRLLEEAGQQNILLLIGPGNNGGDGLVAARYFKEWGARVTLFLVKRNLPDDPNLKLALDNNLDCTLVSDESDLDNLTTAVASATVVVDALLGTGTSRPLDGFIPHSLDIVRTEKEKRPRLRIVALDVPSGLNADTGAVDPACLRADHTITLAFPKRGLFNPPGIDNTGQIHIVDIGIPEALAKDATLELTAPGWVHSRLPGRPPGANKGTFGKVLVVAGSSRYIGAAHLASSGAYRVGAGLVTLATPASLTPIIACGLAESTYLPLPESAPGVVSGGAIELIRHHLADYDALLVGCGLGREQETTAMVQSLLLEGTGTLPPLVVDADALNILSTVPNWWKLLSDNAILTPHPGEMARLTGKSVEEVQSDRVQAAADGAAEWGKTVVLKGAYTVTASPEGPATINPSSNPGLATAGTGDVLSGVIAGLLAQGVPLTDAAVCGVFLHGQAGERVRARLGDTGMMASDILPELPVAIKNMKEYSHDV